MGHLLRRREWQVALLLATTGATNDQIARALALSPKSVKRIIGTVYAKLGFASNDQLDPRTTLALWVWKYRQNPAAMLTEAERAVVIRSVVNQLVLADIHVAREAVDRALDRELVAPRVYRGGGP